MRANYFNDNERLTRHFLFWGTIFFSVCSGEACRRSQERIATSAAEAQTLLHHALEQRDRRQLYALIDDETHWAVESIFDSYQKMRVLIGKHYPAERRERDLRRTALIGDHHTVQHFFAAYVQEQGVLPKPELVASATLNGTTEKGKTTLHFSDGKSLSLCDFKEHGWKVCSLRDLFEPIKRRAAQELASVEENVKAYTKEH